MLDAGDALIVEWVIQWQACGGTPPASPPPKPYVSYPPGAQLIAWFVKGLLCRGRFTRKQGRLDACHKPARCAACKHTDDYSGEQIASPAADEKGLLTAKPPNSSSLHMCLMPPTSKAPPGPDAPSSPGSEAQERSFPVSKIMLQQGQQPC